MDRTMKLAVLTGLILGVLLAGAFPALGEGADEQRGPRPQDFFIWEFLGGAVGGAFGGQVIIETLLSSWCKEAEDPLLCRRAGRVALRPIAYPLFVFAGATVGITAVGTLSGVEGNLIAAAIGSFAGAVAGLVEAFFIWNAIDWLLAPGRYEELVNLPEMPEFLKRVIPLVIEFLRPYEASLKEGAIVFLPAVTASLWGTIGFNSGARLLTPGD